jgi:hypothetical protein
MPRPLPVELILHILHLGLSPSDSDSTDDLNDNFLFLSTWSTVSKTFALMAEPLQRPHQLYDGQIEHLQSSPDFAKRVRSIDIHSFGTPSRSDNMFRFLEKLPGLKEVRLLAQMESLAKRHCNSFRGTYLHSVVTL